MQVTIDSREQTRIDSAKKYFKEQGLEVTVEELEIGDYIFSDGNDEVCFEFKLISDFISSIQDGRVFNQCISQSENFNHHFCVIHGDLATRSKCIAMTKNYRQVTVFQYISAICSINRYSTVIQVSSPFINESYYTMMTQAKKCLQNKPIVKKFPKKHKNSCMNYLTYCVYGLNGKRANDIVNTLDLHTLEDLLNVTHQQLTSVPGIGDKMADRIIDTLNNDTYES